MLRFILDEGFGRIFEVYARANAFLQFHGDRLWFYVIVAGKAVIHDLCILIK